MSDRSIDNAYYSRNAFGIARMRPRFFSVARVLNGFSYKGAPADAAIAPQAAGIVIHTNAVCAHCRRRLTL